jgi:K+-transporting ATPase ATPase C chain
VPQQHQGPDGKPEKYFAAVATDPTGKKEITDLQGVLFDAWLQAHPDRADQLQKVPADMVMTSGSGLDPHITLRNALYQVDDHVAEARAAQTKRQRDEVRQEIEALLRQHAFTPQGGLVGGEPLVNVLEVNRALNARFKPAPAD